MDQLNEIVFQNKNKKYGAYLLRKRYNWNVSIGLFFAIIIFSSITIYVYLWSLKNANDLANYDLNQEIAEYEQYNTLKDIDTIQFEKPVQKKKIVKDEDKTFVVVDSTKQKVDTIQVVKLPEIKKDSLPKDSTAYADKPKDGSDNGSDNGVLYTKLDVFPQFPGGVEALLLYLRQHTHYPEEAKNKKITGIVQIEFIVTKNGDIAKVAVKKGVNTLLDNEAMRVVKSFPKWKPAKRKGYPIDANFVLPFRFML
jgi:protein TonB